MQLLPRGAGLDQVQLAIGQGVGRGLVLLGEAGYKRPLRPVRRPLMRVLPIRELDELGVNDRTRERLRRLRGMLLRLI